MKEGNFICIAGKNNVAAASLSFLVESNLVKKDRVLALPNSGPDNPWMGSLRKTAEDKGVTILKKIDELYGINNLVFISLEYDKIIDLRKFSSQELFNIHFSMLPAYKGCYTSSWPILNGEKKSGVTLHKIDRGIDTGPIIDQIEFPINMDDTARDLYFKYNAYGAGLFRKDIRRLIEKKYRFKPQSSEGSSYYSRKSLDFRNLNWEFARTAYQLHCQLRAFIFPEYQLPRVHGSYIIKSQITERRSLLEPGGVVSEDEASLEIATIDYNLKLYKKTDYA